MSTASANCNNDDDDNENPSEHRRQARRDAILQKASDKLIKKNKDAGDILDDPNTEDAAFGNLFGSS